jgi:hypothetical protein
MKMFAICAALAITAGCTTAGGKVEIVELAEGAYAATDVARAVAVFDQASYREAWHSLIGAKDDPPVVDFASRSAVFVLGGRRPTGGYEVEVRGVRIEGEELIVDAVVNGPSAGSMVTQALTSPYAIVEVTTRSFKNVRWDGASPPVKTPVDQ